MPLAMAQIKTSNKYEGRRRPIRVIVIHTGETEESTTAAEGMCNWAANPAAGGSFHVAVDTDSMCRSVDDADTAWGAPSVNADGLHLEHAGRAGQTSGDWDDVASRLILRQGARVVADWSATYSIPLRWLTDAELADGVSPGLCTHAQASRVFGGDHWDPGPAFPHDLYLRLCIAAASGVGNDMEEDDMQPADLMSNDFAEWMRQALFIQPPLPNAGVTRDKAWLTTMNNTTAALARLDALDAAVHALAEAKGIDAAPIVAAIDAAGQRSAQVLRDALDGATVTLDTKAGA